MKLVPPDIFNGRSIFLIVPMEPGWRVTVHRNGLVDNSILAATRAEACRLARPLSESGLVGFITEVPALV